MALPLLQLISNAHVSIGLTASCCGRPEMEARLGSAQRHTRKKLDTGLCLVPRTATASVCFLMRA